MFQFHDIAGYNGKDVEIYVFNPLDAASTPTTVGTDPKSILRGAQSFEPTEEMAEERVSELGYEATKAIYGAADYGVSIGLLARDLLQLARVAGNSSNFYTRLVVTEFKPVNLMAYYKDPNDGTVNFTKYAGGFKSRTASAPVAAGGNAEFSLEGAADLVVVFDGQGEVVQHVGDNSKLVFSVPADTTEAEIILVETPAGVILTTGEWSYTGGVVTLDTAPNTNAIVRIVHTNYQTANIVS